jgi:isocitrate dehydrogenase
LRKRAELDSLPELEKYADKLEKAVIGTIEDGKMTKDLAAITNLSDVTALDTLGFIREIRRTFEAM